MLIELCNYLSTTKSPNRFLMMSVKILGCVIEYIELFLMCMFEELGGVNVMVGPLVSD